MLNRIADRRAAKLYDAGRSDEGPMDEDAAPRAAAVLAAVTNAIPVGAAERPIAHVGRLGWRAAVLVALVALAYLPTLLSPTLLAGESDAFARQFVPTVGWADWRDLPNAMVTPPRFGPPTLLRILLKWDGLLADARIGPGPMSHRAAGLVLHAAVTVVLWLVLRRLSRPGAWLAAALFAVNPGSAAAVEWLVLRGRPWAALMALAACWLLLLACAVPPPVNHEPAEFDPDEEPRGWRRWPSLAVRPLAALIGLALLVTVELCQPTAVAVGGVVILLVAWRRGLRPWDALWIVPVLAAAVAATVLAVRLSPPAEPDPDVTALPAPLRLLWWTGRALQRVAWPLASADLALAGPRPVALATCAVGAGFALVLVALVVLRRRLGSGPAVAAGCFALLLPTMWIPAALPTVDGLTAAQQVGAASTYLVAIPVLVVLADAIVALVSRVRADLARRGTELAVAAVAVGVLGCVAAVRAAAYQDVETILKTARVSNGRSWDFRSRLAEWYLGQGRPGPALDVMAGLNSSNCPDAITAVAQGDLLADDGDLTHALDWYHLGHKLDPDAVAPVVHESDIYLREQRVGDAIDTYERAIAEHPNSAELFRNFGQLLHDQGDLRLAEKQLRRSLELNPDSAESHVALAVTLNDQIKTGDAPSVTNAQYEEVAKELGEAVRLDPENASAFHDAGVILVQLHDYKPALKMLRYAANLRPELPMFRNDLGVVLIALQKYKEAEFELTFALKLQPDLAAAQSNLAICRRRMAQQRQRSNIEGK